MKSSSWVTVTWVEVAVGAADLATTSCGRLMSLALLPAGWLRVPKISPTAGPTVMVSVAPSIPAGMLGRVLPWLAAAVAALSALKVKTACAWGMAA